MANCGDPLRMLMANGPERFSLVVAQLAEENDVVLEFISPCKPSRVLLSNGLAGRAGQKY